jgi:thiol-disulfide isomerase/thioredoxin
MTRFLLLALSTLAACDVPLDCGDDAEGDTASTCTEKGDDDADDDGDDDGDGFTNGEETEAGTNPDYVYSRPYTGGYNVGFCDTPPVPTGATDIASVVFEGTQYEWPTLALGDVPNNLTFMDQHGEMVDLYSFCGRHVVVLISAGWCPPCRAAAEEMQARQDTYRDQGVQFIEMLTGDNYDAVPSLEFLQGWAEQYAFTDIPVLSIPAPTTYEFPQFLFDNNGSIPSMYHLNTLMEVISADDMVHDPGIFL